MDSALTPTLGATLRGTYRAAAGRDAYVAILAEHVGDVEQLLTHPAIPAAARSDIAETLEDAHVRSQLALAQVGGAVREAERQLERLVRQPDPDPQEVQATLGRCRRRLALAAGEAGVIGAAWAECGQQIAARTGAPAERAEAIAGRVARGEDDVLTSATRALQERIGEVAAGMARCIAAAEQAHSHDTGISEARRARRASPTGAVTSLRDATLDAPPGAPGVDDASGIEAAVREVLDETDPARVREIDAALALIHTASPVTWRRLEQALVARATTLAAEHGMRADEASRTVRGHLADRAESGRAAAVAQQIDAPVPVALSSASPLERAGAADTALGALAGRPDTPARRAVGRMLATSAERDWYAVGAAVVDTMERSPATQGRIAGELAAGRVPLAIAAGDRLAGRPLPAPLTAAMHNRHAARAGDDAWRLAEHWAPAPTPALGAPADGLARADAAARAHIAHAPHALSAPAPLAALPARTHTRDDDAALSI